MQCSDKVRYKSKKAALKIKKFKKFKHRQRVYFCPICYGWHLTSHCGLFKV